MTSRPKDTIDLTKSDINLQEWYYSVRIVGETGTGCNKSDNLSIFCVITSKSLLKISTADARLAKEGGDILNTLPEKQQMITCF